MTTGSRVIAVTATNLTSQASPVHLWEVVVTYASMDYIKKKDSNTEPYKDVAGAQISCEQKPSINWQVLAR